MKWLLTMALPLTGCQPKDELHQQTATPAAADLQPGLYQVTESVRTWRLLDPSSKLDSLERQARSAIAAKEPSSETVCVTPDSIRQGLFTGSRSRTVSCTFDRNTVAEGRIEAALRCEASGAPASTFVRSGVYDASSYRFETSWTLYYDAAGRGAAMNVMTAATRLGDCPPEPPGG